MTLLLIALAWCAGIVAAALGGGAWWPVVALAGIAFGAGCVFARRPVEAGLAIALTFVAVAGIARYESDTAQPRLGGIVALNGLDAAISLRGEVESVEQGERTQQVRLRVETYREDEAGPWVETSGLVLLTLRPFPELAYGDSVVVHGQIDTPEPFDGFDYRTYLERQGIGSVSLFPSVQRTGSSGGSDVTRSIIVLRERLGLGIEHSMPEPEASLAKGILLGQRGSIPDELTEDFNISGISHLIAISGSNVMLVAAFCTGMLWPLMGRRPAIVVSILVVVLYAVLVGGSPSVLRATLMAAVVLGAGVVGRPKASLPALVLTVAGLTAVEPGLVDEVSFQLSVTATAGIVIAALRIEELIGAMSQGWLRGGLGGFVAEQLAVTAAASIAVLPIMALTFGSVSLVALPANLLAGPVFSAVLLSSAVSALIGAIDVQAARIVGEATYLPVAYLVLLARGFASVPGASAAVGGFEAAFLTTMLAWAGYAMWKRRVVGDEEPVERLRVGKLQSASLAFAVLAAIVWWNVLDGPGERLEVTILDVGQGDAILIETPDGRVVLVDGGPSGSRLLNELGEALPASERRIDLVVLTHPQEDHVAGLAALAGRYDIALVMTGPESAPTAAYDALLDQLAEFRVPVMVASAGSWAELGDGLLLEVLAPADEAIESGGDEINENSVVMRLVYGNVSFLLTGDIGFPGEAALLDSGADVRASVLKVGHHGSDGSTSAEFLAAVAPAFAVISSGVENNYGHPSPTTRLRLAGIPTLRTDLNGRVRFLTDGRRLWVEPERGSPELLEVQQGQK